MVKKIAEKRAAVPAPAQAPTKPAPLTTLWLLLAFTAVGLLLAPQLILRAPTEPTMGFVQRIFYFHVPCAWLAMLAALTCGVASGVPGGMATMFSFTPAAWK